VFAAALFFSAGNSSAETLNIGILKNDYFKSADDLRPFAVYVRQLNKYTNYRIIEENSPEEIAEALSAGRIQMAFISVYPAVLMQKYYSKAPDMIVTAQDTLYTKSCIFVLKDSSVKWVSDLKDKTIAFSSPHSTGGYYLPAEHIAKAIGAGHFKRLFSEKWEDVFTQVFLKKADAGATQYADYEEALPPLYRSVFRTVAETESIPGLFLYIRSGKEKKELIRSALSFSTDGKKEKSVINGFSSVDFDWKTLYKSVTFR
jgi:ABC-type phosphate/phosphonate transport system substrate-binding protein